MSAGLAILLLYVAISAWNQFRGLQGISTFESARAASFEPDPAAGPAHPPADIHAELGLPAPDYRLWSQDRIADHFASLLEHDEPPQGLLHIDRLGVRAPIYNGANELNLNRGVARILGTGRIGSDGNLGIAGHRDGYFRVLKDIRIGDRISIESLEGTTNFVVASIRIVDPTELEVLAPTDAPAVTLVTCYPFYFVGHAPQRFIVKGVLQSNPVSS